MSRSRIRILWIFLTTAIVATTVGTLVGTQAASARTERQLKTIKFVVDYTGNLNATWHIADAVHQSRCSGDDQSGTVTSSVRPGHKRFLLVLSKEFSSVDAQWKPSKGVVNYNRAAQGWMMGVKDHKCQQIPLTYADCGSATFNGIVQPMWVDSSLKTMYLEWQMGPDLDPNKTPHCATGEVFDPNSLTANGAGYVPFSMAKLYRCGVKKGRHCSMKISSSKDFPFHATQGDFTQDSSVHIDWSVTFRAVKK